MIDAAAYQKVATNNIRHQQQTNADGIPIQTGDLVTIDMRTKTVLPQFNLTNFIVR